MTCIDHGYAGHGPTEGYSQVRHEGRLTYRHRLAYCQHHGVTLDSIDGQVVRHTCDNSRCINPAHLILGTHADNSRDMVERGRHGFVKLTQEQALEIRSTCVPGRNSPTSYAALARKFGVSHNAVRQVHVGLSFKEYQ